MMESSSIDPQRHTESAGLLAEHRRHPRIKLPAMYTLVRVRPAGSARYCWTGYIYDISQSGMRIELDEELPAGSRVEVRVMLPGREQTTFTATGQIVRNHEDEPAPGPVRMGLAFEQFQLLGDQGRLESYIAQAMTHPSTQAA